MYHRDRLRTLTDFEGLFRAPHYLIACPCVFLPRSWPKNAFKSSKKTLKQYFPYRKRTFDPTFFYPTFVLRLKLIAMKATLLFIFNGIGMPEIVMIGLFVLIFFGAKRIPEFMKGLGKGVREFKDAVKDVKKEVEGDGTEKIGEGK